mmetsp:Transcript_57052/g.100154  ORF Transcript_57052/g.100154 Transcript_57052/m.100154 type:complete len:607 (+) Transcript_57052:305-2125(+)
MHTVRVTVGIQTVAQKVRCAVGDQTITFHLSHAETSCGRAALHGLTCGHRDRTAGACVDLVVDQVLQALVERRAEEDKRVERAAGVAVVHALVAVLLVAQLGQVATDLLHRHVVHERCGITFVAEQTGHLAEQTLHQVTNGHARRNGMRVHHDIRTDAFARERQIFLTVSHSDGTFLSVTRGKLVSDLRDAGVADAHLGELVAVDVCGEHHAVDDALLVAAHRRAVVLARHAGLQTIRTFHGVRHGDTDQHIIIADTHTGLGETICVQLLQGAALHADAVCTVGLLEGLVLQRIKHSRTALGLRIVRTEEARAEQATVDGGLVHDQGILLVVSGVAGNADDAIHSTGQLSEMHVLHRAGRGEGLLRVVQHVGHRVHAHLEGGQIDAHGLLAHRRLVGVTRGLVVIREGNDGRADSKDHGRVDLAVRESRRIRLVCRQAQIFGLHRHHAGLFLLRVNQFHQAVAEEILPAVATGVTVLLHRVFFVHRTACPVQLIDVLLLDRELLVLAHHKQRAHDAAQIGVNAHLAALDVAHDRHFRINIAPAAQLDEIVDQVIGVVVHTHPVTVHKHLGGLRNGAAGHVLERIQAPLVEELINTCNGHTDTDVRH